MSWGSGDGGDGGGGVIPRARSTGGGGGSRAVFPGGSVAARTPGSIDRVLQPPTFDAAAARLRPSGTGGPGKPRGLRGRA